MAKRFGEPGGLMNDQFIISVATKVSMALGGGTVASGWLGVPIGEWGQLIAGLSAFGALLLALFTHFRNKK